MARPGALPRGAPSAGGRWALASLGALLAGASCLLVSPLDDVADTDDQNGGGGAAVVARPPVAEIPGSSGAGAGGAPVCAGAGGAAGSATVPLEDWCRDPIEIWSCNNPYRLRLTNRSESCPELDDTEFFVSTQAGDGCRIVEASADAMACAYTEVQECATMVNGEEVPVLIGFIFVQDSPADPIEGVFTLSDASGTSCSYDAELTPISEL